MSIAFEMKKNSAYEAIIPTNPEGGLVGHSVVRISSASSAEVLETHNGPNRPISQRKVRQYLEDMEAGRWHFDASPLRFSQSGKLLDGQVNWDAA